ncbi:MAG: polymer-forming cytoskeletal protein [Gammaproteobacteria bacterium]|nr:MAG: polymer-forming cytoskeletal protein [Gammaproteobacteria bacterium]
MLGNKNKTPATPAETTSLIALGTHVRGDVTFSGRLHVDGSVQGSLHGEGDKAMLTLSNNAKVAGEIHAPHVVINGTVTGDVSASSRLELAAGARVEGNVYYRVMEMSAGAQINGKIVHGTEQPARQLARADGGREIDTFILSTAEAKP